MLLYNTRTHNHLDMNKATLLCLSDVRLSRWRKHSTDWYTLSPPHNQRIYAHHTTSGSKLTCKMAWNQWQSWLAELRLCMTPVTDRTVTMNEIAKYESSVSNISHCGTYLFGCFVRRCRHKLCRAWKLMTHSISLNAKCCMIRDSNRFTDSF